MEVEFCAVSDSTTFTASWSVLRFLDASARCSALVCLLRDMIDSPFVCVIVILRFARVTRLISIVL